MARRHAMITYHYKCKNCAHKFDAKQKITEEPIKLCPYCNMLMLERVLQPSKFALQGKDWTPKFKR